MTSAGVFVDILCCGKVKLVSEQEEEESESESSTSHLTVCALVVGFRWDSCSANGGDSEEEKGHQLQMGCVLSSVSEVVTKVTAGSAHSQECQQQCVLACT